jgi:hypothetical protein
MIQSANQAIGGLLETCTNAKSHFGMSYGNGLVQAKAAYDLLALRGCEYGVGMPEGTGLGGCAELMKCWNNCNDGDSCTDDVCNPDGTCTHTLDQVRCAPSTSPSSPPTSSPSKAPISPPTDTPQVCTFVINPRCTDKATAQGCCSTTELRCGRKGTIKTVCDGFLE